MQFSLHDVFYQKKFSLKHPKNFFSRTFFLLKWLPKASYYFILLLLTKFIFLPAASLKLNSIVGIFKIYLMILPRFLGKCYGVTFTTLGTTDFQNTIQYSCMAYQNAQKRTLFVYFLQQNIHFNLIGRSSGKIK